jgi:hypothetical protein
MKWLTVLLAGLVPLTIAISAERPSRMYVTQAASSLVDQGLAAAAPSGLAGFEDVPAPGIRFRANEAQATTAPWIDSNAWRFQRGIARANYSKLPAGSAALAAAEAFTYGVDAVLNPDGADVADLGKMLQFLKAQEQAPLPAMSNIAVVDDRSPAMDEVLNMLTRRNLLFRVVPAPDRKADLTVQLGSKDFPREAAQNPSDFAARVREKLGDDRRLVRLYGTNTVIAHLTGEGKHARLFLLSYGRARGGGGGGQQSIRVRVLGTYQPVKFAGFGAADDAKLTDVENPGDGTEFSVPNFNTVAIIDLETVSTVLESARLERDVELHPDPNSPEWVNAPRVVADRDYLAKPLAPPTEIRSRWTKQYLYLLYVCPYDQLNLKPDPNPAAETPRLWNWEVGEAFIGSDFEHIGRYKELQVSPQSEWVDLDIDRDNQKGQQGMAWNSGYTVKGRIDAQAKVWYGEMRIPFSAIDARTPEEGRELRIGLYRIAGVEPKKYYAWRPTGQTSFHVPQAFGTLRLR